MKDIEKAVASAIDSLGPKLVEYEALVRDAAPEVWRMEVAYQQTAHAAAMLGLGVAIGCTLAAAAWAYRSMRRELSRKLAEPKPGAFSWERDSHDTDWQTGCLAFCGALFIVLTGAFLATLTDYLNAEREALHALVEMAT